MIEINQKYIGVLTILVLVPVFVSIALVIFVAPIWGLIACIYPFIALFVIEVIKGW